MSFQLNSSCWICTVNSPPFIKNPNATCLNIEWCELVLVAAEPLCFLSHCGNQLQRDAEENKHSAFVQMPRWTTLSYILTSGQLISLHLEMNSWQFPFWSNILRSQFWRWASCWAKDPVVFVRFPIIIIIISAVQIKVDWVDYGFPSVSSDHLGAPEHIWKCIKFGKQVRTANNSMKCENENASCHWWPIEGLVLHKPIGGLVLYEPVQPSCRIEVWRMCGPINAARSFISPLFCSLHNV